MKLLVVSDLHLRRDESLELPPDLCVDVSVIAGDMLEQRHRAVAWAQGAAGKRPREVCMTLALPSSTQLKLVRADHSMARPPAQERRPASASAAQDGLDEGSHDEGAAADERGDTHEPTALAGSLRTAFLDVDEVLCIGQAEACLELSQTFARGELPNPQQLAAIFSPVARNALAVAHRRSGGMTYVISSSWREHFSREQMASVLRGGGLCFVADHLHEGEAWRCLPKRVYRERQAEILHWLSTHHQGEPFVVLDDHHSAGRLAFAHHFPDSLLFGRVILCAPGVGLTMEHVDGVVDALRHPA